tara:strand:+ start:981 stop:1409 length:429 start_codon:yes stop_codon:yes gene_type:complete
MAKSTFEKNGGYFIGGVAYMDCKITGEPVANVSTDIVSVIGSRAVQKKVGIPKEKSRPQPSGRPAGWHFMGEFVDKDGTVYHRGVEQPKLKGTLKPTKVVAKKKTKRRTKEEILIAREADKKAALKKAVKKQKDFLNHKFGG